MALLQSKLKQSKKRHKQTAPTLLNCTKSNFKNIDTLTYLNHIALKYWGISIYQYILHITSIIVHMCVCGTR